MEKTLRMTAFENQPRLKLCIFYPIYCFYLSYYENFIGFVQIIVPNFGSQIAKLKFISRKKPSCGKFIC